MPFRNRTLHKYLLTLCFSEVLKALLKTRELYERWRLGDEHIDLRSAEEQEWAATELRNSLRSIEWDLEDLDDTVNIVEKNPAKFKIDPTDLAARKAFIQQTKEEVENMKARSSSSQSRFTAPGAAKPEVRFVATLRWFG